MSSTSKLTDRIEKIATHSNTVSDSVDDDTEFSDDVLDEDYDYDHDQEEEEIVEIDEEEMMHMLDEQSPPLLLCRRLFHTNPAEANELQVLTKDEAQQLYERGFVMLETGRLATNEQVWNGRCAALELDGSGGMTDAAHFREGEGDDPYRDRTARTDRIAWLHHDKPPGNHPAFSSLLSRMDALRSDISSLLHLSPPTNPNATEIQLALYSGQQQGGYTKHRDAFPVDDINDVEQRRVTAILYLNDFALNSEVSGGCLRITTPSLDGGGGEYVDVAPVGGRVVVFMSGAVDHEVLNSKVTRVALTCWWK
ncbi:hypothetical protein SmJEL517_g03472 [Synchytrium microbalum]|uniref:Fe2OG dioxygenase domain-containing protein n=1 Tax=Synchytrium microbalum TaxID=1806994 RepID=A0A507BWM6_9FUNG|nr:uncharacterized protein SmJEL517_g03472 [Synchytrium microbalum]TPX33750.1 hypothetical protein SmJEL517_g03472 [Synchytrium microbalum]